MEGQVVCDPESNVCRIVPNENGGLRTTHPLGRTLGDKLLKGKDGEVEVSSLLGAGKVLALYFSAHWCPPCKGFTPRLANFYKEFKEKHARAADFDIIFVSSDKDQESFDQYFAEMPWLALPYADRKRKAELSIKYRVSGIPTVILLDGETGKVITKKGREMVIQDPEAKDFPWAPTPATELLKGGLVNKDGQTQQFDDFMAGKYSLIYFSAHWCPPCRVFTPQLAQFYKFLKEDSNRLDFEVIYISGDREEEQFQEYLQEMPWWAVPYSDEERRKTLSMQFEVESIPTLIVLGPDGQVITKEGRSKVTTVPQDFPWSPKPVEKLDNSVVKLLNTIPVCFLFTPSDHALTAMEEFGKKMLVQAEEERDLLLLTAFEEDTALLQQVKKISGEETKMAILVIQSQSIYKNEDLSESGTRAFLQGFLDGTIKGEDLKL